MRSNMKQQVTEWIASQDYEAMINAASEGSEKCLRYAQMNIWGDSHDTQRWYAITAMGKLAEAYCAKEDEVYRNVIRRAVWAMSDESGNVPWAAPEMMAVIIKAGGKQYQEFVRIMVTNGMDNPMCHAGMLWAVGYLGAEYSELIGNYRDKMIKYLSSKDDEIRGMATWAFLQLGYEPAREALEGLREDQASIWLYRNGVLKETTIAGLFTE